MKDITPSKRPVLKRKDEPKPKRITASQQRIIDHIERTGDSGTATAQALGLSRSYVSQVLNKPHVMADMQFRIQQRLRHGSLMAVDTVTRLAQHGKSEYVKLQASQDLLDRAGFKPPDKHTHQIEGDLSIHIDLG